MDMPSSQMFRSECELMPKRPVMPVELFNAAIKGNSAVLIRRLGLQRDEQTDIQETIEAPYSASEETKTENQTVQSELQSATRFGDTILHLLITERHNKLALKVFQRDNSLLKAQNNILETPLYCAAKVGNEEVIHYLIESNRAVVKDALTKTNKTGDTALLVAAKYGHKNIGKVLMVLDATVTYKVNDEKKTPLYMAIIEGFTLMVQHMLKDDHTLACSPFSDGVFPVHEAARMGNLDLVLHFMDEYPDYAELRDPCGSNFLHIAAEENKEIIFEVFKYTRFGDMKKGMITGKDDYYKNFKENDDSRLQKWREMIKRIITAKNYEGNTPFHIAENDDPRLPQRREMIERMITAQNYEGNTPFHIAAMKGNKNIMRAIWKWKHYKDTETELFELTNNQGCTPFELSAKQVVKNNKDIDDDMIRLYEGNKFSEEWFNDYMEQPLEDKWERTQVIGLGSVLITTVAFAAAFTMPGGYDQDHGTPVLGRKYMFRAFILANALAFIQGFLSLFALLIETLKHVSDRTLVFATMSFVVAASSMVVAFGLAMYVTLALVCLPIAILLLVISLLLGTTPVVIFTVELLKYILGHTMNSNSHNGKNYILWAFCAMSFLFIFGLAFV